MSYYPFRRTHLKRRNLASPLFPILETHITMMSRNPSAGIILILTRRSLRLIPLNTLQQTISTSLKTATPRIPIPIPLILPFIETETRTLRARCCFRQGRVDIRRRSSRRCPILRGTLSC